jgi:multicomponent Na+:H+ antiporter subunit D
MDLLAPGMAWAPLSIALPLLAALLAVPMGRRAPYLLWVAAPGALVAAFLSAGQVWTHGRLHYALGHWPAPLGIELRLDGLAAIFLCLSGIVCAGAGAYARIYFAAPGETRKGFSFWPLFFGTWAGLNAVFLGADLFNLYVALELITLAAVALVALDGRAATFGAAMRYLLFAMFGSLAYLIGVVLIYGAYETLDMGLLGELVAPEPAIYAALALISIGLLAKTALFPFHGWLPPAHSGAPAPASALLSALVVKASFYILLRLWFDVLPPLATQSAAFGFGLLGSAAVLFGSIYALRQQRLKLIVAYSTVAQLGYLFLIFPLAGGADEALPWSAGAWSGGIYHALAHGLAKAAMFMAAGAMALAAGSDRLDALAGVAKAVPVASFAFAMSAVSLMGLPPSGGFLAKYLMLTASFAGGQWGWGVVLLVGGLLSAVYLFRPLNQLMVARPDGATFAPVHWGLEWIPLLLAMLALALGIFSFWPYELIQHGGAVAAGEGLT